MEKRWYVVQTYAGYENKVMTNLLKRIETMNMQEKIFRVLIPEEKEVKIKDGVRKEKMRKTFPGYVLVEMIDTDDSWYMVRNTPGVTGFLGSSGKGTRPVPLPTEEVMPILKKMGITSVEVSLDIQVGQRVLVAAGPFSGQVGTIESIDQEHSKVRDVYKRQPSTFDKNKLSYINNRYIKALEDEELLELCMPHLVEEGILEGKTTAWAMELISLFHDRLSYGAEIVDLYDEFFSEELELDEEAQAFIAQDGVSETLKAFKTELEALEDFNAEGIQAAIKAAGKAAGAKGKMLFMPCRIATTGQMHGPDLPKALALLGKETVVGRIAKFI